MAFSSVATKDIARIGANIEITPTAGLSSVAVKDIVRITGSKGLKIAIHAEPYSSAVLKDIARIGGDSVTIVM